MNTILKIVLTIPLYILPICLGVIGVLLDVLWIPVIFALTDYRKVENSNTSDIQWCDECGDRLKTEEEKERGYCDRCSTEDSAIVLVSE